MMGAMDPSSSPQTGASPGDHPTPTAPTLPASFAELPDSSEGVPVPFSDVRGQRVQASSMSKPGEQQLPPKDPGQPYNNETIRINNLPVAFVTPPSQARGERAFHTLPTIVTAGPSSPFASSPSPKSSSSPSMARIVEANEDGSTTSVTKATTNGSSSSSSSNSNGGSSTLVPPPPERQGPPQPRAPSPSSAHPIAPRLPSRVDDGGGDDDDDDEGGSKSPSERAERGTATDTTPRQIPGRPTRSSSSGALSALTRPRSSTTSSTHRKSPQSPAPDLPATPSHNARDAADSTTTSTPRYQRSSGSINVSDPTPMQQQQPSSPAAASRRSGRSKENGGGDFVERLQSTYSNHVPGSYDWEDPSQATSRASDPTQRDVLSSDTGTAEPPNATLGIRSTQEYSSHAPHSAIEARSRQFQSYPANGLANSASYPDLLQSSQPYPDTLRHPMPPGAAPSNNARAVNQRMTTYGHHATISSATAFASGQPAQQQAQQYQAQTHHQRSSAPLLTNMMVPTASLSPNSLDPLYMPASISVPLSDAGFGSSSPYPPIGPSQHQHQQQQRYSMPLGMMNPIISSSSAPFIPGSHFPPSVTPDMSTASLRPQPTTSYATSGSSKHLPEMRPSALEAHPSKSAPFPPSGSSPPRNMSGGAGLPATMNGQILAPAALQQRERPDASRPLGQEICLECLMRDRDMADVEVTGPGVWSRDSDIDFEEALRAEEQAIARATAAAAASSVTGAGHASSSLEDGGGGGLNGSGSLDKRASVSVLNGGNGNSSTDENYNVPGSLGSQHRQWLMQKDNSSHGPLRSPSRESSISDVTGGIRSSRNVVIPRRRIGGGSPLTSGALKLWTSMVSECGFRARSTAESEQQNSGRKAD